ncbi:periplasmic heavy metal sensor [bacterium]|nr:MAG: periplasmic heavy metal sensor [bacterium]
MKTPILLITLFALGTTTQVIAQPGGGLGGQRQEIRREVKIDVDDRVPGFRFDRMAEVLELTDDQKAKIEDLQLVHFKKMQGYRNQLGEKRAQERTLVTADKPDTKKINALIDEMGDLKTTMKKAQITHRLEVRSLLTDKQKIKFDAMMNNFGKGGRGQGQRPGRGQFQPDWK